MSKLNLTDKELRKKVVGLAYAKLGWTLDDLHDMMQAWGFGRSLRELPRDTLEDLYFSLIKGRSYRSYAKFDKQGNYMWSQAVQAWPTNTMKRLQHYWLKKFKKTHWMALDQPERRATINMLGSYYRKSEVEK